MLMVARMLLSDSPDFKTQCFVRLQLLNINCYIDGQCLTIMPEILEMLRSDVDGMAHYLCAPLCLSAQLAGHNAREGRFCTTLKFYLNFQNCSMSRHALVCIIEIHLSICDY